MLHHKVVAELIGSDLACSHEFDHSCDTCRMRVMCLPAALDQHHLDSLKTSSRIAAQWVPVKRCTGRRSFYISYAILNGSVKTYTTHEDGWTRITGCHLPGEIFGFSGIGADLSQHSRALEIR